MSNCDVTFNLSNDYLNPRRIEIILAIVEILSYFHGKEINNANLSLLKEKIHEQILNAATYHIDISEIFPIVAKSSDIKITIYADGSMFKTENDKTERIFDSCC